MNRTPGDGQAPSGAGHNAATPYTVPYTGSQGIVVGDSIIASSAFPTSTESSPNRHYPTQTPANTPASSTTGELVTGANATRVSADLRTLALDPHISSEDKIKLNRDVGNLSQEDIRQRINSLNTAKALPAAKHPLALSVISSLVQDWQKVAISAENDIGVHGQAIASSGDVTGFLDQQKAALYKRRRDEVITILKKEKSVLPVFIWSTLEPKIDSADFCKE